jgi:hypothetical protein
MIPGAAHLVTQNHVIRQYQHREERNMKSKIVAFIGYQRFKCIGIKDASTKNGRPIRLLKMQSHCPECGKPFVTTITKRALRNNRSLNRRCEKCKNPRVTIETTRKKLFGLKSVHPEV